MHKLTRRSHVIAALEAHFTKRFNGKVWADFDPDKRKYYIRGEGLPAAKELRDRYPNGWSLLAYFTPREARAQLAR